MAALTIITYPAEPTAEFDIDGEAEAVSASSGGDTFVNSGTVGFWVKNTAGVARTVTFDAPRACNFGFTHDAAVVVADGFEGFVWVDFDADRFNSDAQIVSVTYSSEVGLKVAAVRLA